jgi:hypothetical protein
MIAVCGRLELARSLNGDPVLAHQATDAPVTDINANLFQFFGHSWAAVTAQAQTRLFLDMRQHNQICPLPAAGRSATESPKSARADVHNLTQPVDLEGPTMFFDEPKPHGFWLAKNWVAFFRLSLSSLSMRFSRQSRSFSRASSRS